MEKPTIGQRAKNRIDKQTEKGLQKYGMLLDDNPAPVEECIDHLAEELADGLQYAEWIKDGIAKLKHEVYRQALADLIEVAKQHENMTAEDLTKSVIKLINKSYKKNVSRT